MKKLLTLALAVLMLASTAISAAAVTPWELPSEPFVSEKPAVTTTVDNKVYTNAELVEYYKLIFGGNQNVIYPGNIVTNPSGIYTRWYDSCEKCKGIALYYVEDTKILWTCLEKNCDGKGELKVDFPTVDDTADPSLVRCPDCGYRSTLIKLDTVVIDSVITTRYFCTKCGKVQTFKATDLDSIIPKPETPACSGKLCSFAPVFKNFFYANNSIYARYECEKGHVTDVHVYASKWPYYNTYRSNIRVNIIGEGKYISDGYSTAPYGAERTFAFYADPGYVLTDVVVNGESYGAEDVITLTITQDTVINAYFEKGYSTGAYAVTTTATGNGKIAVLVNNTPISNTGKFGVMSNDTVKLTFVPLGKNYEVVDVKIDGKSVGAHNSYTLTGVKKNTDVEVTFAWDNPFVDVTAKYEKAVQYVSESGIMDYTEKFGGKAYFEGKEKITVSDFVCALIEMADTADNFDTEAERLAYAELCGIIGKKTQTDVFCDVQTAADIVCKYLNIIEKANKIDFANYDPDLDNKTNGVSMGLCSSNGYKLNRDLTRYDLAAVCYLIQGLKYTD